jgi:hypothetical protein
MRFQQCRPVRPAEVLESVPEWVSQWVSRLVAEALPRSVSQSKW